MNRDESLERNLRNALRARAASPCPGEETLLAFYRGDLSEAEGESVREHLAGCASCVDLARDARAFLETMESVPERSRSFPLRWLAAAAVLAVALLAGLWVARRGPAAATPPPVPAAAALVSANPWRDLPFVAAAYRPPAPEDELVFRSEEEAPPEAAFAAAMSPYARGDYAAADVGLARFLQAHPGHAEAAFYRGVSLLMLGKPEEARALLESAAASSRPPAEVRWYLALALLKSGEPAAALAELDAVGRAPGPHRAEAAELSEGVRRALDAR
ncbi:MAG: tetratricopeptide repeat protein [Thermoanaerobaculia bacterium]